MKAVSRNHLTGVIDGKMAQRCLTEASIWSACHGSHTLPAVLHVESGAWYAFDSVTCAVPALSSAKSACKHHDQNNSHTPHSLQ